MADFFILTENNPIRGERKLGYKMAKIKIGPDASFQVLSHSFSVSPSSAAYTLQYSADGIDWTDFEDEIPADETLIVNGCAFGQFIRLDGYTPYDEFGTLVY